MAEGYGDPLLLHAIAEIKDNYGDDVFIKPKSLHKFGRTENADNGVLTTISRFQDDVVNETLSTTNDIDSIISTSADDTTQTKVIEGHKIDAAGNLYFQGQEAELTGQTRAALSVPLARVSRCYVKEGSFGSEPTGLAGDVAVYVNVADTDGKPNTDANVKLLVAGVEGRNQSEKAATSFSRGEYGIITDCFASINRAVSSARADVRSEVRRRGGVFRVQWEGSMATTASTSVLNSFRPYIIMPPNSDLRLRAVSSGADTIITGGFDAFFGKIK